MHTSKYIEVTNETIKTLSIVLTAIATSLAANFSYLSVQEARAEASYAREYVFLSEKNKY